MFLAGVVTHEAATTQRAREGKERIEKLKETKTLLKEKVQKHKITAQCCGKELE
jgi:hypothetical protein